MFNPGVDSVFNPLKVDLSFRFKIGHNFIFIISELDFDIWFWTVPNGIFGNEIWAIDIVGAHNRGLFRVHQVPDSFVLKDLTEISLVPWKISHSIFLPLPIVKIVRGRRRRKRA
jgi:hypothetical protein